MNAAHTFADGSELIAPRSADDLQDIEDAMEEAARSNLRVDGSDRRRRQQRAPFVRKDKQGSPVMVARDMRRGPRRSAEQREG